MVREVVRICKRMIPGNTLARPGTRDASHFTLGRRLGHLHSYRTCARPGGDGVCSLPSLCQAGLPGEDRYEQDHGPRLDPLDMRAWQRRLY